MLHDPAKTYEHEPLRKLKRPGQKPDQRSQKRLDWHTCMPPVDWLHPTPSGVIGIHNTPEPFGAWCSANCARRAPALHPVQRTRHPSFFGSSPSVSRMLTECLRALTEPPGSKRTPPGVHRTPSGVHGGPLAHGRALRGLGRAFRGSLHDLRLAGRPRSSRTTSVVHRCEVFATELLRKLTEPPGSTGTLRRPTEAGLSRLAVMRR